MATGKYATFAGFKRLKGDASNPTHGIVVDDASHALHICEPADADTDWNVSADTHPSIYIHSATTPATEYVKISTDATTATILVDGANLCLNPQDGLVQIKPAGSWTANGTVAATLTNLGVAGSATAVAEWLTVYNEDGSTRYIPSWAPA